MRGHQPGKTQMKRSECKARAASPHRGRTIPESVMLSEKIKQRSHFLVYLSHRFIIMELTI